MFLTLFMFIAIILISLSWYFFSNNRQVATEFAINLCDRNRVSMLEGTSYFKRFTWIRGKGLSLVYAFEYSCHGHDSQFGHLILHKKQVISYSSFLNDDTIHSYEAGQLQGSSASIIKFRKDPANK